MKQTIASLVLAGMLFPSLAFGDMVKMDDLVITNGLYYKKFTTVPFTGKVEGNPQGSIENGNMHGTWTKFDSNGRVKREKYFRLGKLISGVKSAYHSNGNIESVTAYYGGLRPVDRNGPCAQFYENKQQAVSCSYWEGKKDGKWTTWYEDGMLKSETSYKKGRRHGPHRTYYSNGQIEAEGDFKDDLKHGSWLHLNRVGGLDDRKSGTYKNNVKVSD